MSPRYNLDDGYLPPAEACRLMIREARKKGWIRKKVVFPSPRWSGTGIVTDFAEAESLALAAGRPIFAAHGYVSLGLLAAATGLSKGKIDRARRRLLARGEWPWPVLPKDWPVSAREAATARIRSMGAVS
jgi:hypothetical protein